MAKNEKNKNDNRHFFKDFKAELKRVIWPTGKQVVNNTTAVITIVLITAAIVFVLDLTFDLLNTQGINKLRNIVGTESNVIEQNSLETNETELNVVTENSIDNTVSE